MGHRRRPAYLAFADWIYFICFHKAPAGFRYQSEPENPSIIRPGQRANVRHSVPVPLLLSDQLETTLNIIARGRNRSIKIVWYFLDKTIIQSRYYLLGPCGSTRGVLNIERIYDILVAWGNRVFTARIFFQSWSGIFNNLLLNTIYW